jgi:NDP-sugar pyrophosphorylase family protein
VPRAVARLFYRNREVIADHDPDVLLVLSADHVYKLDYADVIADQLESGAAVTMVTTNVAREDASRYGVVQVDREGLVREFEYKPDAPAGDLVTTEVFAYDATRLLRTLDELAEEGESSGLRDFGHELLPQLVTEGAARAFQLDGYWRDVGTIEGYWQAHMELLRGRATADARRSGLADLDCGPSTSPGTDRGVGHHRRKPGRCRRTRTRNRRAVDDRSRGGYRGRRRGSGCHPPPRQLRRRRSARDARNP